MISKSTITALSQLVQEIGTASLKNYLDLASRWFGADMSQYNFYLMPLSFYHGFESAEPVSVNSYNEQTRNFLRYVESLEEKHASDDVSGHQVTVGIETKGLGRSTAAFARLGTRAARNNHAPREFMRAVDGASAVAGRVGVSIADGGGVGICEPSGFNESVQLWGRSGVHATCELRVVAEQWRHNPRGGWEAAEPLGFV